MKTKSLLVLNLIKSEYVLPFFLYDQKYCPGDQKHVWTVGEDNNPEVTRRCVIKDEI